MKRLAAVASGLGWLLCLSVAWADDAATAQAGARIYAENCAQCHGDELRSTGAAFDLTDLKPDERSRFDTSVLDGKGQMPPWRGVLSPGDLDALWAYIRADAAD